VGAVGRRAANLPRRARRHRPRRGDRLAWRVSSSRRRGRGRRQKPWKKWCAGGGRGAGGGGEGRRRPVRRPRSVSRSGNIAEGAGKGRRARERERERARERERRRSLLSRLLRTRESSPARRARAEAC